MWARKAFEKIISDDSLENVFVAVRYQKPDAVLMKMSEEYQVPVELCRNINTKEFVDKVKQ